MTNDAERLAALAQIIYGPYWQTRLAQETGVSDGTVSKWANNKHPISNWVWVFLALKRDLKTQNKEGI